MVSERAFVPVAHHCILTVSFANNHQIFSHLLGFAIAALPLPGIGERAEPYARDGNFLSVNCYLFSRLR